MKVLHTHDLTLGKLSSKEQLALYSGMDVLSLFEIRDQLLPLLTPTKQATYKFEMELQAVLLEMSFNGIPVDTAKRNELIGEHKRKLARVQELLQSLIDALGFNAYYADCAAKLFAAEMGVPHEELPRTWDEWLAKPLAWRREIKAQSYIGPFTSYQKALKQYSRPFNGNSVQQKLRLFYDFFGHEGNLTRQSMSPDFPPPWSGARGIHEHKARNIQGEFTPTASREALEKIQLRALDLDPRDAHYWALPFVRCCLDMADLTKTLGFLNCKLEKGYFKASFGAVTETGRLNSKENAQGFGSNAQNITPPLRIILTSPLGWKSATPDYEQIESRNVGAICFTLFGATAYLNGTECGDLHTLVCSMVWKDKGWPEDFSLTALERYGPFPKDLVKAAKTIANQPFYRHFSHRDAVKRLGHGCLTADHEVLTPDGWVSISQCPPVIAQYSDQGKPEFVQVSHWTKTTTKELVVINHPKLVLSMTRDHRVINDRGPEFGYEEMPAEALLKLGEWDWVNIPTGSGFGKVKIYRDHVKLQKLLPIPVYCPTVPEGVFYVRRQGHISVTGNSNYRGQPPHMAKMTHIPVKLIEHFQAMYFTHFPEIPQYHRWVAEQIQTKGEITTIFGRTRKFFGRPNDDSTLREAIAYSPQSMAADYTNRALLRSYKAKLPLKLFLQKHDEIGFRFLEQDQDSVVPAVCSLMEEHITLTAPNGQTRDWYVPAEPQVGWNLGYASPDNPDGLIKYPGSDTRVRQSNPFDFAAWKI